MRTHISLEVWSRLRAINWILGGIGLLCALFYSISHQKQQAHISTRPTLSRLAFSPDGKTLVGFDAWMVGGSRLLGTRAWDVGTGKQLWSATFGGSDALPAAFLPNSSTLAQIRVAYGPQGNAHISFYRPGDTGYLTVQVSDARSGRTIAESTAVARDTPFKPVSIDVSPDGRSVVVAVEDGMAVWELPFKSGIAGSPLWFPVVTGRRTDPVQGAKFTHDSRHLVVSRLGLPEPDSQEVKTYVEVWDRRTAAIVHTFGDSLRNNQDGSKIASGNQRAALSPDRQRVATLSHRENSLRLALWDVETGEMLAQAASTDFSRRAQFDAFQFTPVRIDEIFVEGRLISRSPDKSGDIIAIGTRPDKAGRKTWRFWDRERNRIEAKLHEARWLSGEEEAVSPNGRLLARPTGRGHPRSVSLFDIGTGKPTVVLE
ncbi:MAG: WD40 repeat domain-containing protein [Armatimonadota bacterium]